MILLLAQSMQKFHHCSAMQLTCDRVFNSHFIANFLHTVPVKEFAELFNI